MPLTSSSSLQPANHHHPYTYDLSSAIANLNLNTDLRLGDSASLIPSTWLDQFQPSQYPQPSRKHKHCSTKKSKSKKHKKQGRKQQLGAYLIQLIGLVCLVLAATKGFEPLVGVGSTLVIVGFNAGRREGGVAKKKRRGKEKREERGRNPAKQSDEGQQLTLRE